MSVLYSKLLHQGRACQLHKQVTVKGCVVYQVTSVHADKEASIVCVLGLQISFSALPGESPHPVLMMVVDSAPTSKASPRCSSGLRPSEQEAVAYHSHHFLTDQLTPPVILEETTPIMTEGDGRIKVVNQNNFVFICIARDPSLYGGKWIQAMAAD